MSREYFDLTDQCQGRKLLLQVYNYSDYICGPSVELREDVKSLLPKFFAHGKGLPAVTSISKSHGASKSISRKQATLEPIEEVED